MGGSRFGSDKQSYSTVNTTTTSNQTTNYSYTTVGLTGQDLQAVFRGISDLSKSSFPSLATGNDSQWKTFSGEGSDNKSTILIGGGIVLGTLLLLYRKK